MYGGSLFFLINSLAHWHTYILANNQKKKRNEFVCSEKNEKLMYKMKPKKNSDIERANVSPCMKKNRDKSRCTFDV